MGVASLEDTRREEFADVYEANLIAIWRYVRSRVPDHHHAQDVTSDVFSRAWRSWGRFDPRKGSAAAWLFGIAHRAVADWWRRSRRPLPASAHTSAVAAESLEHPLDAEALARLGTALARLSERDRDALALRFAGELSTAEIAEVLGTSTAAAKMTLSRATRRLRDEFAAAEDAPTGATVPEDLGEALESTVQRHGLEDDPVLSTVVAHLSVVHRPAMPERLPERIAACVGCDQGRESVSGQHARSGRWSRVRPPLAPTPLLSTWVLLGTACLTCVWPAMGPVLAAIGLHGAGLHLHNLGLALAPVVAFFVYRQARRHGRRAPVVLAVAGAALLAVHALLHIAHVGSVAFITTNWTGTLLLLAGALAHLVATARWVAYERRRLEERVAHTIAATAHIG